MSCRFITPTTRFHSGVDETKNFHHLRYGLPLLVSLLTGVAFSGVLPEMNARQSRGGEMLVVSEPSRILLEDGRTLLLRLQMSDAEQVFGHLLSRPDGRLAALYHLELASFLKLLVTDREQYYVEYFGRSDSLRSELEAAPASPWKVFFEAESKLRRAVVRAKKGNYLRAAFAGRGAYRAYVRLVEAHPDFYDAYKGLGLVRMAVGSLPSFYRTFLGVFGIRGSVDEGLHNLTVAADSSRFSQEESVVLLNLYDLTMDTDHSVRGRLSDMYNRYPDSPLLAHLEGFALYSERKAHAAEQVLRPAAERFGEPEYFFVDYVDFFLADALFRQDEFQQAVVYFQRYLDNHAGPALKATASLRMGLALEMIDHRLAAESFYMGVEAKREFDSDQAARRAAARRLESPMSATDRALLLGRNAFDSGRNVVAVGIFRELLDDGNVAAEQKAEAAYRLGRTYHVMGSADEAQSSYRKAVDLSENPESRWAPWAEYYSGRIFEEEGDAAAATSAYERAAAYPGSFDYHQALEKNVVAALQRLSQSDH